MDPVVLTEVEEIIISNMNNIQDMMIIFLVGIGFLSGCFVGNTFFQNTFEKL